MSLNWVMPRWARAAWRRWRQRQAWEQRRREFVYLDEVSVTSLVAARHGSVAESFKHTLSSVNSAESGSSLTVATAPATLGAGLTSRTSSSRTTTQEVVRRAVVQGTFRTLRIGDSDLRLSVEDQSQRSRPTAVETVGELARYLDKLEKQRRAVRASDLQRGDVVEVRVELRAERTYQITAAVTSILDLVQGRTSLFGISEAQVAEMSPVLELLPRLLVDLVPIAARVTSHRRVVLDNEPWLIDASMIAPGSQLDEEAQEVVVAGVTELPLYWKDVRRVLFDGSTYTVYARVAKPGLESTWSPVKLADVFDTISQEIGNQIRVLPLAFDSAATSGNGAAEISVPEVLRTHGLVPFGRDLAGLASRNLNEDDLQEAAAAAAERIPTLEALTDVGAVRAAFEEVVRTVESAAPLPRGRIDRELVRTLREAHQTVAQLKAALAAVVAPESSATQVAHPNLLEVEFIAIYW